MCKTFSVLNGESKRSIELTYSLISHFTLASDGREHLRVSSVQLEDGDQNAYKVESVKRNWERSTVSQSLILEAKHQIISPSQPLSCLFKIRKRQSGESDLESRLLLIVQISRPSYDW